MRTLVKPYLDELAYSIAARVCWLMRYKGTERTAERYFGGLRSVISWDLTPTFGSLHLTAGSNITPWKAETSQVFGLTFLKWIATAWPHGVAQFVFRHAASVVED